MTKCIDMILSKLPESLWVMPCQRLKFIRYFRYFFCRSCSCHKIKGDGHIDVLFVQTAIVNGLYGAGKAAACQLPHERLQQLFRLQ